MAKAPRKSQKGTGPSKGEPAHRKGSQASVQGKPASKRGSKPDGAEGGLPFDSRWMPLALYTALALALFRAFVFSDQMLLGTDTLSLGYAARAFFADALRGGHFPLWNPYILGGTPFLESVAGGDSLYPTSLLLLVMDTYRALGWKLVLHLPVAGLAMFLWTRSLGRSRHAALLAGLGFMLAPYMVSLVYPGQDGKLFVTALAPLVFWAADRVLGRGGPWTIAALAAAVGLVILTTHFQMAYFLFGAVGIFAIFRTAQALRSGRSRSRAALRFGYFLAASVLGAGVAAVQLLPSVEYVLQDSRRTATTTEAGEPEALAYSASWSLHPEEAVSLVVPEFVGNSAGGSDWTTQTYWGRNVFKLNHEYIGVLMLLLAGLAFLGSPQPGLRQFFVALGGISFLFALGANTPVWRLFYEWVPGVDLFRAPSMAIFLTGLSVSTLAAFGVDRGLEIVSDGDQVLRRRLMRYLGGWALALGVFLVLAATGLLFSFWQAVVYPDITPAKAEALVVATPFIQRGAFLALALCVAMGAIWWGLLRAVIAVPLAVALMAGLITLDLARIDLPFIQTLDYQRWAQPNEHETYLQQARNTSVEPFRVLSMIQAGQDVRPAMFGIELAAGHHPNDLHRYRTLIGMEGSGVPRNFFPQDERGLNLGLLWALNVRYLLWPDYQFGPLGLEPATRVSLPDGRPYTSLYEIPGWHPRAYLVDRVVVETDAPAAGLVYQGVIDPRTEAVLGVAPEPGWGLEIFDPGPTPAAPIDAAPPRLGAVTWNERGPDQAVLQVSVDRPSLLVVSQNWLPGWTATVGGTEAPVVRVNHSLQGVPVPEGTHEVRLAYRPASVFRAFWISGFSVLLVLGLVGAGLWERRMAWAADTAPDGEPPTEPATAG